MDNEIQKKLAAELRQAQMLREIADTIPGSGVRFQTLKVESLLFLADKHEKNAKKITDESMWPKK